MTNWKTTIMICGLMTMTSSAFAQIRTVYSPYVAVVPTPVVIQPQYSTLRPLIAAPVVAQTSVTAYRPVVQAAYAPPVTVYRPVVPSAYTVPSIVAPTYANYATPTYSAYRPIVPVAPVAVPVYSAPPVYRPGVVGFGVGGVPTVYTPGQPVRNVLRYVAP